MKKMISALLVLVLISGLTACGAPKAAETAIAAPETTAPQAEPGLVVDTRILKEADDKMLNTYTVIAVNP